MQILAVVIVAIAVGAVDARDIQAHEIMECKAKNKVPIKDLQNMKDNKLPQSKGGKCMIACLMKKMDMMTRNGKVSVNGMHAAVAKKHRNNPSKLQRAKKIINECASELERKKLDECETAVKMTGCTMKKAKELKQAEKDYRTRTH